MSQTFRCKPSVTIELALGLSHSSLKKSSYFLGSSYFLLALSGLRIFANREVVSYRQRPAENFLRDQAVCLRFESSARFIPETQATGGRSEPQQVCCLRAGSPLR